MKLIDKDAVVTEIERRIKVIPRGETDKRLKAVYGNEAFVLNDLLSFIDSIQEEPKECMYSKDNYTDEDRKVLCDDCEEECEFNKKEESINNGLDLGCGVIWKDEEPASDESEKVVEEIVDPTVLNAYGVKEIANRLRRTMIESVSEEQVKESLISKHEDKTCKEKGNSLTQEPVSIDFEQELYKAFGQVKDFTLSMRIAKWFYDMGKNSQEPVSEDLKEEMNKMFPILGHTASTKLGFYDTASHFANWQKQQMMKEAVSGHVGQTINGMLRALSDETFGDMGFTAGDKVKLIILKEG